MKNKPFNLKGVAEYVISRVERLQDLTGQYGQCETLEFIQQAFDEWETIQELPERPKRKIVEVAPKKRIQSVEIINID